MLKSKGVVFCIITLLLMVWGCGPNVIFEKSVNIPEGGWHKDTVAVFKSEVSELEQASHLLLQVKNTNVYGYSNIWFFVDAVSPSGHVQRDTLECPLANAAGDWYGKSSWGAKTFKSTHPYKLNIRFPEKGLYKYYVVQGMRDTVLTGIAGVGIKIIEVE